MEIIISCSQKHNSNQTMYKVKVCVTKKEKQSQRARVQEKGLDPCVSYTSCSVPVMLQVMSCLTLCPCAGFKIQDSLYCPTKWDISTSAGSFLPAAKLPRSHLWTEFLSCGCSFIQRKQNNTLVTCVYMLVFLCT